MNKLLIADDDIELCQLLKDYLSQEGFSVDFVHDGNSALKAISKNHYDLLILDVMMPLKNGFDTLKTIRQDSELAVLMLTAKGDKIDRILGLEMGADDYVAKPCDPRELVARIRAITRRLERKIESPQESIKQISSIEINDVYLDQSNRQVTLNKNHIELTSTEFDILRILMENSGKLVTRNEISETCIGKKLQAFDRSIDMHLSNVRKKLGDYAEGKQRIKTIRGSGYQYLVWND